ncbi:MAG: hypothetical protein COY38_00705 [Candidatus Aenigmarchaeota archaeon CG_4_10_14_0_8_um_filter_37_24]|nr:hypothetical protein [Candidatus Aenigmarchaeota archaeon]OIN86223.1 MAG: hypothetical protein AUJ50_04070 [Candidatus Aenigmarchaeota archaeon CG1_02_38_14]PIV68557.1 MAG: hypothetical protein COS07_03705 [Candidatus Aenigmarchaeota archaeon CG01_land_8_20_14_3_00_37_9]PIW41346.1 MAG: hypothetical protein COW21_02450 [Candidatus Aenigmarchaeota archaeon CG15_BIG_FIL_POST_REV_8_21_14_020_37_27]PIX50682.1 MAG: hypothetical protein COZ52_02745 [Candidatus Aenigmarchaeota archaeon CG_4_8_14_3_u
METLKKSDVIDGLEDIRYVLLELERNPRKLHRLSKESELIKRKDGKILLVPKKEMKNIIMI